MKKITFKIVLIIFTFLLLCSFKCLSPGTPESQKIFFYTQKTLEFSAKMMNVDGTDKKQLFVKSNGFTSITVSPDGTKILYTAGSGPAPHHFFIANIDGTNEKQLSTKYAKPGSIAFSPDGNKIAFIEDNSPGAHIFIMNADGSNVRQITSTDDDNRQYISYSPDGQRLAFTTGLVGLNKKIYTIDINTGKQTQHTFDSNDDMYISFSPDANKIVYVNLSAIYIVDIRTN